MKQKLGLGFRSHLTIAILISLLAAGMLNYLLVSAPAESRWDIAFRLPGEFRMLEASIIGLFLVAISIHLFFRYEQRFQPLAKMHSSIFIFSYFLISLVGGYLPGVGLLYPYIFKVTIFPVLF